MNLKQNIRRVLKEETNVTSKVKQMVNKIGFLDTFKLFGGYKKVFEILELDYYDIRVQEEIVKNYLYHNEIEDILFLEVKRISPDKTVIKVYLNPKPTANHKSFFDRTITDEFNKNFPFKILPVWEFEWKKTGREKIFITSEEINEETI